MKIFTFKKVHLVIFVCLITCICGIIIVSIGGAIQANATPAMNKTVILDARASVSLTMEHRVQVEQQNKN